MEAQTAVQRPLLQIYVTLIAASTSNEHTRQVTTHA